MQGFTFLDVLRFHFYKLELKKTLLAGIHPQYFRYLHMHKNATLTEFWDCYSRKKRAIKSSGVMT
jgi:hypothetical protein